MALERIVFVILSILKVKVEFGVLNQGCYLVQGGGVYCNNERIRENRCRLW